MRKNCKSRVSKNLKVEAKTVAVSSCEGKKEELEEEKNENRSGTKDNAEARDQNKKTKEQEELHTYNNN